MGTRSAIFSKFLLVSIIAGFSIFFWILLSYSSSAQPPPPPRPPNLAPNYDPRTPMPDPRVEELRRAREAYSRIPETNKIWIDNDTIVYLLPRDPHLDMSKGWRVVVSHLPTKAVINYDESKREIGRYTEGHPDAPGKVNQLNSDSAIRNATIELLRRVGR